jgi:predicted O-methyltransferase YrrM
VLLTPLLKTLRAGDMRLRLAALRSGRATLDVAMTGSALSSGILARVDRAPASTDELAEENGWSDLELAEAFLRALAAAGLLAQTSAGWAPTGRGRRILRDDVASAAYQGFGGYHVALYRELPQQLAGGPGREDIERDGQLVARLSRFMDEFVLAELDAVVRERPPTRILDVGCGAAAHLVHLLQALPSASGVGAEVDDDAADLAETAVREAGVGDRARIVRSDVRDLLAAEPDLRFDLVLLSNLVYYVPLEDRVAFLRSFAERLDAGGRVVVVTTALTDDSFSRHFDLLLRAQTGALELPDMDVLAQQAREAGLEPGEARRIAPGEPLTALVLRRP